MLNAILDFYTNYANFKGRTGLKFYRIAIIYNFLGWFSLAVLSSLILDFGLSWIYTAGAWIFFHLVPISALQTRRMHDLNQSGAATFIIGSGIRLFWEKGTVGDNKYGPQPNQD